MWVPPETKDPVVYHHPTRRSIGYFAAVRMRDGALLFRRETGRFNGESFWEFLKVFRETSVVKGRRVVAISDNARYHRSRVDLSWRQLQASQFESDFLPPYSPDWNPIERVWKLTRRLCLRNRYFGFLERVVEAVENQFTFTKWIQPNDTLCHLCAITEDVVSRSALSQLRRDPDRLAAAGRQAAGPMVGSVSVGVEPADSAEGARRSGRTWEWAGTT
jgi:transposase